MVYRLPSAAYGADTSTPPTYRSMELEEPESSTRGPNAPISYVADNSSGVVREKSPATSTVSEMTVPNVAETNDVVTVKTTWPLVTTSVAVVVDPNPQFAKLETGMATDTCGTEEDRGDEASQTDPAASRAAVLSEQTPDPSQVYVAVGHSTVSSGLPVASSHENVTESTCGSGLSMGRVATAPVTLSNVHPMLEVCCWEAA